MYICVFTLAILIVQRLVWLEGTLPVNGTSAAGLWLQTSGGGWACTVDGQSSVFTLASTDAAGKHTHRVHESAVLALT